MAILTDHKEEKQDPKNNPPPNPNPTPSISSKPPNSHSQNPKPNPNPSPFTFWFYFTLTVSLFTFLSILISSLTASHDPKSQFLNLPAPLRTHFLNGRTIKVQLNPNQSPIEVFAYSKGERGSENVLFVHGLGCSSFTFREMVDVLGENGVFGVAVDLPGSGFSDKVMVVEREGESGEGGVLGRLVDVYDEIREKGLFWGFDSLIEHGHLPLEEEGKAVVRVRKSVVAVELGAEEIGRVLGQVVDSLGLAPVHLVLHDSALLMSSNWVSEKVGLLRSVTLVDTMPRGAALPMWVFGVPVVREVVLGFDFVFRWLIDSCCSKSLEVLDLEAHRSVLKSSDARRAILGMGKKLNYSFELADWANSEAMKGVPVQVVWSSGWSKEWTEEGRRVAEGIPGAKFVTHSGGRWPQGDASKEIAEHIISFVASLPKTIKQAEEEFSPELTQKKFDESESNYLHHHEPHDHDHAIHDHHGHAYGSYMDTYGLGQGWEI